MARLLMMTDFSELYARQLLQGILRYSYTHTPWVVRKLPLSLRDAGRLQEVADFAASWKADAIIGQFRKTDPVDLFRERGILTIAQDFEAPFPQLPNISGDYALSGQLCARYLAEKGLRHFAYLGLKGMVWSEGRRDAFVAEVRARVPGATVAVLEIGEDPALGGYDQDLLSGWLRALPRPAALLACDDNRAYYVVETARQMGGALSIPEDLLVLGVDDDSSVCELCEPPLSSLGQDAEDAGYRTAALIERLSSLPVAERLACRETIRVAPGKVTSRLSTAARIYDNPHVSRVVTYIQGHLHQEIRVEDLTALVPFSRKLLQRAFREETGITLYQYVVHARVERMRELMDGGMTPFEAADALEADYKNMNKQFKKVTGMTPTEYLATCHSERSEES